MAAALTDKLKKVGVPGTLTALAAPGKAVAAASINVNSTTNWPTDTAVILAIRQVDATGKLVAGTYTEFIGTVSGTTITLNPTPVYGTDQIYTAGSTTQVYIPVSARCWNDVIDALLAEHTQAGLHSKVNGNTVPAGTDTVALLTAIQTLTNKTFTSPVLTTPSMSTPSVTVWDGWVGGSGTWTFATATTMTVPAADAAAMAVGDRIKLTQTTVKYFYVIGISGTTITLTGGSDYTLVSAAITSPFYSHMATPAGFPQWFNFAAAVSGLTSATSNAQFTINGRTCTVSVFFSGTSNATSFGFTLPVTSSFAASLFVPLRVTDNGATPTTPGLLQVTSASTTATLFKDLGGTAWTASGTKTVYGTTLSYEI